MTISSDLPSILKNQDGVGTTIKGFDLFINAAVAFLDLIVTPWYFQYGPQSMAGNVCRRHYFEVQGHGPRAL